MATFIVVEHHFMVTPKEKLGDNQSQTELSIGELQHRPCKPFIICWDRCGSQVIVLQATSKFQVFELKPQVQTDKSQVLFWLYEKKSLHQMWCYFVSWGGLFYEVHFSAPLSTCWRPHALQSDVD